MLPEPSSIETTKAAVILRLVDELNDKVEEAVRAGMHVSVHATNEMVELGGSNGHDHRLVRAPRFEVRIEQVTVFNPGHLAWDPVLQK